MADLLEQAASWLGRMCETHLARPVTYQRGGQSVELAATLGSTAYEVADDSGAAVEARATDFLVAAADLVLGGEAVLPAAGDRIRVASGGTVEVYEVMAPGGQAHYRPSDPYGLTLRIHAKRIGQETG